MLCNVNNITRLVLKKMKSLEDVVPWSLIYGELNKRHQTELDNLIVEIVVDHLLLVSDHGWPGCTWKTKSISHCISNGMLNDAHLDLASKRVDEMHISVHGKERLQMFIQELRKTNK